MPLPALLDRLDVLFNSTILKNEKRKDQKKRETYSQSLGKHLVHAAAQSRASIFPNFNETFPKSKRTAEIAHRKNLFTGSKEEEYEVGGGLCLVMILQPKFQRKV